jgi:hypothetical protein
VDFSVSCENFKGYNIHLCSELYMYILYGLTIHIHMKFKPLLHKVQFFGGSGCGQWELPLVMIVSV